MIYDDNPIIGNYCSICLNPRNECICYDDNDDAIVDMNNKVRKKLN
jgi:hypothetical protein